MARARREDVGGRTYWGIDLPRRGRRRDSLAHLLPIYDEYLIAYRDREVVPHGPGIVSSASGAPVTFQHAAVIAGQVAGTWRIVKTAKGVSIAVTPLRRLTEHERREIESAAARYERFREVLVDLSID
jgi:hypothetical protein